VKRQPWHVLLDKTDKGVIRPNLANAVTVLQKDPLWTPDRLWHDEFLDRILVANSQTREWRDDDDTRLTVYMQQETGMPAIAESIVASAVRHVARQRSRHCVRDRLTGLIWDALPRIALAFEDCWGVEATPEQPLDYIRAVSANLFIGMIARIMAPGCHLDNMVVFEGAQGIGKSKALRVLGAPWYLLSAESVSSKDFFQVLPGCWLAEIGELDSFSKAERERVKVAISTPEDTYRSSYGRHAQKHPRQCVFAGTTNRDDWGNDDTGLRRFWPIRCGIINVDAIAAIKDQWFAEALVCYRAGATWWETPLSTRAVQADRQAEDAWTPTVLDWLIGRSDATSGEILINALKFRESEIGRPEQNRIGSILRLAGWTKKPIRRGARLVKAWVNVTDDDGNNDAGR
jgi:predicted P-loop ATPase